jgi:hypothetical protein
MPDCSRRVWVFILQSRPPCRSYQNRPTSASHAVPLAGPVRRPSCMPWRVVCHTERLPPGRGTALSTPCSSTRCLLWKSLYHPFEENAYEGTKNQPRVTPQAVRGPGLASSCRCAALWCCLTSAQSRTSTTSNQLRHWAVIRPSPISLKEGDWSCT